MAGSVSVEPVGLLREGGLRTKSGMGTMHELLLVFLLEPPNCGPFGLSLWIVLECAARTSEPQNQIKGDTRYFSEVDHEQSLVKTKHIS